MAQNTYKAIFFDLDGTLLPMDVDHFLRGYFESLAKCAAQHGYNPQDMCECVGKAVNYVAYGKEPGTLNSEVFWSNFRQLWGPVSFREEAFFETFYETTYNEIAEGCQANPAAARAINALKAKGYPLYLTTMPLFPQIAVEKRLEWAGVDPGAFEYITCYDNSTAVKPSHHYYLENIARVGLDPSNILMVGNNTKEDLVAMELGLDGYLVTDYLINPNDYDIDQVKHGSLADFADFAESLAPFDRLQED